MASSISVIWLFDWRRNRDNWKCWSQIELKVCEMDIISNVYFKVVTYDTSLKYHRFSQLERDKTRVYVTAQSIKHVCGQASPPTWGLIFIFFHVIDIKVKLYILTTYTRNLIQNTYNITTVVTINQPFIFN